MSKSCEMNHMMKIQKSTSTTCPQASIRKLVLSMRIANQNEPQFYILTHLDSPKPTKSHKIMHMKSKLPKFVAMLVPDSMTNIIEHSWNAFPKICTEYSNSYFGEKFHMSVETMHADDRGTQENAVNLTDEDLSKRKVVHLNIASDTTVPMEEGEDPTKFVSAKTDRGNLKSTFIEEHEPIMTCYKVCKLRFKVFGLQSKVEQWGHQYGLRAPFLKYHRKLFCWIDEWYGLTLSDIRAMEAETARITKQKIEESKRNQEEKSSSKVRAIAS